MAQKWKRGVKKPLFCLKFSLKKLYFIKNSLLKKPLFSKEPARGPALVKKGVYENKRVASPKSISIYPMLQIRRGKSDNVGIIFFSPLKRML